MNGHDRPRPRPRPRARVRALIAKDLRTGSRDQLVTYMLLAPVILGLLLALLMPMLEGAGPRFAVTADLDPAAVEALAAHGEVEVLADRPAVEARVLARDDVLGVVPGPTADARPEALIEGDEPEVLRELAPAILDRAARRRTGTGTITAVVLEAVGSGQPQLPRIAGAILGFCIVVIAGMIVGFTILEESASNMIAAYRVSPLGFAAYLGGKLVLASALALLLVIPALALPLGLRIDWLAVEVMTVASLPFALSLGLCIGAFARDQLGAVAVLKALLPLWTSLPVLGFVLPEDWLWTQWIFANHWGVQGYFAALSGRPVGTHAGLALLTGLPVLAAVAAILRRRLGFVGAGG